MDREQREIFVRDLEAASTVGSPGSRRERSEVFLSRWRTDVEPVHQRTERTREFRTQYAQLGLKLLTLLNATAIVALPLLARALDVPVASVVDELLLSESFFLAGLALVLLGALFGYITLDVDVVRHKAERVAARIQVIQAEFPEECGELMDAELESAKSDQGRFWKIGVSLSWVVAAIWFLSWLCLIGGGVTAGAVLAAVRV